MAIKLQLNAQEIFAAAETRSGLRAYADDALRERFAYLIGLFNEFGSIKEKDFPEAVRQLTSTVVKRLQVARDWAEYPEILDEEIVQPFFVLGSARAGTTFTQMLLELDEGHRTPRYRDVQHPSPPRGLDRAADDAALAEQNAYVDFMVGKSPRMLSAHPYLDQLGESEAEDEYVYSLDFDLAYPLWYLKVPSLPQSVPPRDAVKALQFHKNMLKQFQWKTPTRRWVGKGVIHQYIPEALLKVFPDMVGFWIHRPPEEYVASLLELLSLQYGPFNGDLYNVKPDELVAMLKAGVDRILSNPATFDPRLHHIRFSDMVMDPAEVFARIYDAHGIPFSDAYADRINTRLRDPNYRADRYGKFQYSLEKYGLKADLLRREFADYCEQFSI
jgi:hypothetical protein